MIQFIAGPQAIAHSATAGDQVRPVVATLPDGSYFVAWSSSVQTAPGTVDQDIYAQKYDATGAKVGEAKVLVDAPPKPTTSGEFISLEDLEALHDGSLVVSWIDLQGTDYRLQTQHIDGSGDLIGAPRVIKTLPLPSSAFPHPQTFSDTSEVTALADGGYLVTWQSTFRTGPWVSGSVDAQRFAADGVPVSVPFGAGGSGTGFSEFSTTSSPDGGWTIFFSRATLAPDWHDVFGRQYDSSGNVEYAWGLDEASGYKSAPDSTTLTNGNIVLVWNGRTTTVQILTSDGRSVVKEMPVQAGSSLQVTALADGGFLLSWQNINFLPGSAYETTVRAQYFDSTGQASGDVLQLHAQQRAASAYGVTWNVTATEDGGFAVAVEHAEGSTGWDVSSQLFTVAPSTDTTAPTLTYFFPADGEPLTNLDWNLAAFFDEGVQSGPGTIALKTQGGTVVETFDAASSDRVHFDGNGFWLAPTADLTPGTGYVVEIASGAVRDLAGNAFAGTSTRFATAGSGGPGNDTLAPQLTYFYPAEGEPLAHLDWNLAVFFDETVQRGTGNLLLKTQDGGLVESFDLATSTRLHFGDNAFWIDPTADLLAGTGYTVEVASGAVQDAAGNAYAGSVHAFSTAGASATSVELVGLA